jgi:hypothetical protein
MVAARLSWGDLQDRWSHYTRQGLYKVRAWPDFPKPVESYSGGKVHKVHIWHLTDITAFEKAHPELTSNVEKWRKVKGYQRALAKGKHGGAA